MGLLFTAAGILLGFGILLKGLHNRFYAAHVACVLGVCWLLFQGGKIYDPFSKDAVVVFLALHLVVINVVTALVYAWDKYASTRQWWRVSEKTLHSFAIVGGTPFALLAQMLLRHKTKKSSFQVTFWILLFLQSLVALYIFYKFQFAW